MTKIKKIYRCTCINCWNSFYGHKQNAFELVNKEMDRKQCCENPVYTFEFIKNNVKIEIKVNCNKCMFGYVTLFLSEKIPSGSPWLVLFVMEQMDTKSCTT